MREIDNDELAKALVEGAAVTDSREPSEYAGAHVHLACAPGNRTAAMADVLLTQAFDAVNVVGGTSAWIRSDRPVIRGVETGATR